MTRSKAIKFLTSTPYKLGHMLGFKDLTQLNNRWIVDMVCSRKDKTLQAHRLSFKTTCVSIAIAIIMVLLPNKRILFLRKTDSDVEEIVTQVKNILMHPKMQVLVMAIWGVSLFFTKDRATEVTTNLVTDSRGTSQLLALGCGGSLTGKHFDYVFTDDIVNIKDRISKTERERTKLVYGELQNIIDRDNGGRIYNTGTPWHKEDAFSVMPDAVRYDCYSTGILTPARIEEKRHSKAMTPSLFAANYELRHIPTDGQLFKESPTYTKEPDKLWNGVLQIDAAYGGDDSTAMTIGNRRGDYCYALGRKWDMHVDNCLPEILRLARIHRVRLIICEMNSDKGYLAKEIRAAGFRVLPYNETMNKYYKISTHLFKWWASMIWLEGTDEDYLNAIMDYTADAEHDDCPDSAASLVRYLEVR